MADDNGNGKTASGPPGWVPRPLPPINFQVQVCEQLPDGEYLGTRKFLGLVVSIPMDDAGVEGLIRALTEARRLVKGGLQIAPAGAVPAPSSPLHIQR
jgi:hypothetical protein